MKRFALYFGIAAALVASCSTREMDFQTPIQDDVVFYASFEQPAEEGTRVYANEDLLLRWTADDRVSIFNKITYNQQYVFTGETGDNAGGFRKVDSDEFVTGNTISHVVSVYPYQDATKITESEVLTVTLPAEQSYAENTFGLGANTMVSVSSDNVLQYKNVGGYLMLKLYGEGVSVESITLKGNNGEKLAGKASISMPLDGTPTAVMANDATSEITLKCTTPVQLGATEDNCTQFWFVLPPISFSKGFTIAVNASNGVLFEKSTSKSVAIERNRLTKMSSIAVENTVQPSNVIYYTSTDGAIVAPNATNAFGGSSIVSNEYIDGRGVLTFDQTVSGVGAFAFKECTTLSSILLPDSITYLGTESFNGCNSLLHVTIPDAVTKIYPYAFFKCTSLTQVTIPEGVTSIEDGTFFGCSKLSQVIIPETVTSIGQSAFGDCTSLPNISLPEHLESIGNSAFNNCSKLVTINFPECLTSIGQSAFGECAVLAGKVVIPNGVTMIQHGTFQGCAQLSSIVFPENLESIDAYALARCKALTEVIIPSHVKSIGAYAFAVCTSLLSITCYPLSVPEGQNNMFSATPCTIYVPANSVDAYKTAEYWRDFADQIQPIPSSVPVPDAVDMGLSVKWASFNLGATAPEEYGDYYAWGETEPKDDYSWQSYKWCMGSNNTMTKYCNNSEYGYNGLTDTKTVLDLEDDAAHVNLGGSWRMPTDDEWTSLRDTDKFTWTWTTDYNGTGVTGYIVTSNVAGYIGNQIFLPANGMLHGSTPLYAGSFGQYWSSSLSTDRSYYALGAYFYSGTLGKYNDFERCRGFAVRPVSD